MKLSSSQEPRKKVKRTFPVLSIRFNIQAPPMSCKQRLQMEIVCSAHSVQHDREVAILHAIDYSDSCVMLFLFSHVSGQAACHHGPPADVCCRRLHNRQLHIRSSQSRTETGMVHQRNE
ncbi:unnamed protein product, partial [Nesidiocoris tenuis]